MHIGLKNRQTNELKSNLKPPNLAGNSIEGVIISPHFSQIIDAYPSQPGTRITRRTICLGAAALCCVNLGITEGKPESPLSLIHCSSLTASVKQGGQSPNQSTQISLTVLATIAGIARERFRGPFGVRLGPQGSLWVCDDLAHSIHMFTRDGTLLRSLGSHGTGPGQIAWADSIAFDPSGNIYIADTGNNRIQVWDFSGRFIREFGRNLLPWRSVRNPRDIWVEPDGTIYVASYSNNCIQVFDRAGTWLRSIGREGHAPGELMGPVQLLVSLSGEIYVSDSGNNRIQVFGRDGRFLRLMSNDNSQLLIKPLGIAFGPQGTLLAANYGRDRIEIFGIDGRHIGSVGRSGEKPGELKKPTTLQFEPPDRLYIAEEGNHRIQIMRLRFP